MVIIPVLLLIVSALLYIQQVYKSKRLMECMEQRRDYLEDITNIQKEIADMIETAKSGMEVEDMEKMAEQCGKLSARNYSDNPIVNAVLYSKQKRCEDLNIHFEADIGISGDKMSDIDTVGLLGNLLDNAIEAAEKVETGERYVRIKAITRGDVWSIRVENAKPEKLSPKKRKFKTTKMDKENHGLGIGIIRKIVKKYEGIIEVTEDAGNYRVTVTM